jgi:hypothetical protein
MGVLGAIKSSDNATINLPRSTLNDSPCRSGMSRSAGELRASHRRVAEEPPVAASRTSIAA